MFSTSSQRYRDEGLQLGVDDTVLDQAVTTIERIQQTDPRITPVLTLRHLSELTGVSYGYLRGVVTRREIDTYKQFLLSKRIPGRSRHRLISIPPPLLKYVQQWITKNILRYTRPANVSFAYHPDCRPIYAARRHCGCKWLLKIDIEDFFHNITESKVSKIFFSIGYPRLLAFELARLTTFVPNDALRLGFDPAMRWTTIASYQFPHEGVLPQGAPTSPMLSNLAMRNLDSRLATLAAQSGMCYTRYSDDLTFSCKKADSRAIIQRVKRQVLLELSAAGLHHNRRKTVIRGPGTRRIVLGMLVNGPFPRLPNSFKNLLRLHIYYLTSSTHGPSRHARYRKTSVSSLYNHIRGLISWAEMVEPEYGAELLIQFKSADWPPIAYESDLKASLNH